MAEMTELTKEFIEIYGEDAYAKVVDKLIEATTDEDWVGVKALSITLKEILASSREEKARR